MLGWRFNAGIAGRVGKAMTGAPGAHRPARARAGTAALMLLWAASMLVAATPALAQSVRDAYLLDARGEVVRNTAFGDAKLGNLCWRTGYWTPALAISQCDPDIAVRTAPAPRKPPVPPAAKSPAR